MNRPHYCKFSIASATFSSSHRGVEVAPHTPTLSSGRNHSLRISLTAPMCQVRMLQLRQSWQSTLPLELDFPATKMMMS